VDELFSAEKNEAMIYPAFSTLKISGYDYILVVLPSGDD